MLVKDFLTLAGKYYAGCQDTQFALELLSLEADAVPSLTADTLLFVSVIGEILGTHYEAEDNFYAAIPYLVKALRGCGVNTSVHDTEKLVRSWFMFSSVLEASQICKNIRAL